MIPSAILSGALAPHSLSLLEGLRAVFRRAGESVLTNPSSYDSEVQAARGRIGALLEGVPSPSREDPLSYPIRAARRFQAGESYSPTRFRALERLFLGRASYLRAVRDSASLLTLIPASEGARTMPSPPPTFLSSRPLSIEDCKDLIKDSAALIPPLPGELGFIDLAGGEAREERKENSAIAGQVIGLPMGVVLDRIFSRVFDIGENRGDMPAFWAEGVTLAASLPEPDRPGVGITCRLACIDDMRAFIISLQAFMGISNPFEILLEGRFEWREGILYIPMKAVEISGGILRPEIFFGTATTILAPIDGGRTILALDLEDKILSKNPLVFVEGMARGLLAGP